VVILPTYGTARVLLVDDAEAREEYMAGGPYTGPSTVGVQLSKNQRREACRIEKV
jgi:hypothetical protein